ncbi:MazG nucleotide pyrophosphohydrolase domain-containing protein [Nonomuraea sp. NPDC026600]|uniref:MazG nucleotide pyrophosphohydrolase domain-containing protein n=1 Tax=Nonomuraea sp. NPDC026600 TaxID=3155363 RepID=UPI0033F6CC92
MSTTMRHSWTIMKPLPERPTFAQLQRYVTEMERERNLNDGSIVEQCLKLSEEVGEVCKAVRKHEALSIDPASTIGSLGHELADVLIYDLAIANRSGIDLAKELHAHQRARPNRSGAAELTLADLQNFVAEATADEHHLSGTLIEQCLLLSARAGTVYTVALTSQSPPDARPELAGGLIGVLQHLAAIANRVNLDLATALRAKEKINETRVWAKPSLRPAVS